MNMHEILEFLKRYASLKKDAEKQSLLEAFLDRLETYKNQKYLFESEERYQQFRAKLMEICRADPNGTINIINKTRKSGARRISEEKEDKEGSELRQLPNEVIKANPHANNYGFNKTVYDALLPITELAYLIEANGNPAEHAYKLAVMFADANDAFQYLSSGAFKSFYPVHDACLFSIPDSPPAWNLEAWRTLALKNQNLATNKQFNRLLKEAQKIEVRLKTKFPEANQKKLSELQAELEREEKPLKDQSAIRMKIKELKDELERLDKLPASVEIEEKIKQIKTKKAEYAPVLKGKVRVDRDKIKRLRESVDKLNNIISLQKKNPAELLPSESRILKVEETQFISNQSVVDLNKIYASLIYQRSAENIDAALLFKEQGASEKDFDHYLDLQPSDSELIPSITIKGSDIHPLYKKYYLKKLDSRDPRAAMLGRLTDCCQMIGGQGEDCAIYGITRPNSGFYVLCKGDAEKDDGEIVSQCWAWRGEGGALVFDSVERSTNALLSGIIDPAGEHPDIPMMEVINDFFTLLATQLVSDKKYEIPRVMVGTGGHTPDNLGWGPSAITQRGMIKEAGITLEEVPIDYEGYRDSKNQRLIAATAFPHFIYQRWGKGLLEVEKIAQGAIAAAKRPDGTIPIYHDWVNDKINSEIKKEMDVLQNFAKQLTEEQGKLFLENVAQKQKIWQDFKKASASEKIDMQLIEKLVKESERHPIPIITKPINNRGESLLMLEILRGNEENVKTLLRLGAKIEIEDYSKKNSIAKAAKAGNLQLLQWFDSQKEFSEAMKGDSLNRALPAAAKANQLDVVKWLVGKGADVNAKDFSASSTPILLTSSIPIMSFLLENKADPNVVNSDGNSLLRMARKYQNSETIKAVIELLEKWGVKIAANEELIEAIRKERYPLIDYLKSRPDIDLKRKFENGMSWLEYTLHVNKSLNLFGQGIKSLVEVFEKHGFELSANKELSAAIKNKNYEIATYIKNYEIATYIIRRPDTDLNIKLDNGLTLFEYAHEKNRWQILLPMLKSPRLELSPGSANLVAAEFVFQQAIISADMGDLVKAGLKRSEINLNAKTMTYGLGKITPLELAVQVGHWHIVQWMIETDRVNLDPQGPNASVLKNEKVQELIEKHRRESEAESKREKLHFTFGAESKEAEEREGHESTPSRESPKRSGGV